MSKERLDVLVTTRGFAESREQARRLIRAGRVRVKDQVADKPGVRFAQDASITCVAPPRFVSRGGEKLQGAFDAFAIDVRDCLCLDVGASTGGFTDCLLQHGAAHVYAVDVGRGQLHWRLRRDSRVTVYEKINARRLDAAMFEDRPRFACLDVSFISLTVVLPAVIGVLTEDAQLVTLVKPQFEAGREQVGKGGVVREDAVRADVLARIRAFGEDSAGLTWLGCRESPLRGPAGNIEYLAWWRRLPGRLQGEPAMS